MIHPLLLWLRDSQDPNRPAMELFYRRVHLSRQAHKQWQKRDLELSTIKINLINEVKQYRRSVDCRAGSRMLFYNLNIKERYDIGVTKFEQILSSLGLSLPTVRVKVVTTKSSKQSWNYENLIYGLKVSKINQVIVGDITYINHYGNRYYFFSLKDVFSGRVVGWSFADNMRAENAVEAFDMFVECRGESIIIGIIHHTDGGGQYFSGLYLEKVFEKGVRMSRAKTCLENGYAEQFNGYLKHHLMPLIKSKSLQGIRKELTRLIYQYNHIRGQEVLDWLSPVEFEKAVKLKQKSRVIKLHDFG